MRRTHVALNDQWQARSTTDLISAVAHYYTSSFYLRRSTVWIKWCYYDDALQRPALEWSLSDQRITAIDGLTELESSNSYGIKMHRRRPRPAHHQPGLLGPGLPP